MPPVTRPSVADQVRRDIDSANASRALFLSVAFGLTYLVGGLVDAASMGTLKNHAFMLLQCLAAFVSAALVRWVVPERHAALFFSASISLSAAFGGAHVAQFGGFDGPWFYGCYTVPPIFIALLVSLRHRVLATAGACVAFTLVYWLNRPSLFEYPMAHVPLVYLVTISGIATGLGQWVYRLEVKSFTDIARLEAISTRLEERLRTNEGAGSGLRAALARQLHDDVAQLITGARFHLDGWTKRPDEEVDDQVERLSRVLDQLSDRAHSMLEQLRAPAPTGPLAETLLALQHEFRALGVKVDLLLDDAWVTSAPAADSEVVITITREALVNAVRHARASEATVSVQSSAEVVSLLVLDNGGGKVVSLREGHGLRGIRERAKLLGGEVELSDYEAGLRLAVKWPRRSTA
jgi:signal transduction histidine kinase